VRTMICNPGENVGKPSVWINTVHFRSND
jgi:hypothetical protein